MARRGRSSLAQGESSSRRSSLRGSASTSRVQTPEVLPTRSKRLPRRNVVANSSDMDDMSAMEQDTINVAPAQPKKRVFEAVVVPHMRSKRFSKDLKDSDDSASIFSVESGSSVNMGNSFDYETPATNKSMTPNGLSHGKGKVKPEPETSGKRKRSTRLSKVETPEEDTTAADEELARALQEEEYGAATHKPSKARGKKSTFIVDSDSDDGDDDMIELSYLSSDEDVVAGPSKRARLANTSRRKAAAAATKNIAARETASSKAAVAQDSDESDLSSLAGFLDNEGDDGSDFTDDLLSEDDAALGLQSHQRSGSDSSLTSLSSTTLQAAPVAASTRPAASRARRVRARPRARNMNRREAFQERMNRRRLKRRLKLESAHPEIKTMWDDLEAVEVLEPAAAEQPQSINRKLKKFQLEGLNWMKRQEETQWKGGLLGDEMGMGKTIQAVSLIMSDFPAKDPTLVVVPPVALMQWQNEINAYTDGKLKVLVYHNTNSKSKNLTVKDIKSYNVLLISYNSLESLYRKEVKGWSRKEDIVKEDSPIHAVQFHRLILDEAHSIKTRTTGVAKACFALKGTYKWCLSGTPVQNRIGEFFSLLRFLQVRPFADYFCEKCPCAQLHWTVNDDYMCDHCGHSASEHRSIFNEELLNPITGDDLTKRERAMDKLHMITARIMLRRMKKDHTSSMELPPKEIVIHNEFFGEIERDFSTSIMTNTARQFDTYVSRGVMLNNYANIFGLIMQMRQVANHPDLLLKKHAEGGQNILVCNICDEPAEEAIRSRCHHEFCRSCVKDYVKSCEGAGTDPDCPRCHIPLSIDWEQPDIEQDEEMVKKSSIINRIKMENWTSSTKIEMLVYDLYKLRSKKQTLKSIVFSQFTSMLQLIEWRLRRAGFNTVMLDGSMTPAQRQRSIDYFMKNTDVEVFLVSLKAGGVALNLTEASRVFIVDPWWNPAAEWQSADRCHRIGQKRPCVITRLCIEDSVESRMVMLQEKKASMISASINNDKVAMEKLSPEDLQFLFRGT